MIIEAILKINPNAEIVIIGEDINTCTFEWHNGTTPISKADIKAMIPTVETEIANLKTNAIAKKASAKTKLKALGLDDAELKTLGL